MYLSITPNKLNTQEETSDSDTEDEELNDEGEEENFYNIERVKSNKPQNDNNNNPP